MGLERCKKCNGFLSCDSHEDNNGTNMKCGFSKVHFKKVETNCFGCKACKCLEVPRKVTPNKKHLN